MFSEQEGKQIVLWEKDLIISVYNSYHMNDIIIMDRGGLEMSNENNLAACSTLSTGTNDFETRHIIQHVPETQKQSIMSHVLCENNGSEPSSNGFRI